MKDQISGTFLTVALIFSNYTSDIFGKDFSKLINQNYMVKLFILYALIFMTVHYETDYPDHMTHFMRTNTIFLIFLMAVKSKNNFLIIIILLSVINRLVGYHLEYLEQSKPDKTNEYKKIDRINNLITYSIIGISIVGFSYEIYIRSQKGNFSLYKFITNQN